MLNSKSPNVRTIIIYLSTSAIKLRARRVISKTKNSIVASLETTVMGCKARHSQLEVDLLIKVSYNHLINGSEYNEPFQ